MRAGTRTSARGRAASLGERLRATPAGLIQPRIGLIAATTLLVLLGLLMIYSASSVKALNESGDAAYYLKRQAAFVVLGVALAVSLARVDYHRWQGRSLWAVWGLCAVLLLATAVLGRTSHGAQRWIEVAGIGIQPSEFAKVSIILATSATLYRTVQLGELDLPRCLAMLGLGTCVPILLILLQPDKGTTVILGVTLVAMLLLAGLPWRVVLGIALVGAVAVGVAIYSDEYAIERLETALNPWDDLYNSSWQITQGYYAFGRGGILGVGIGRSRQKYSWLPEAYTDFIFAVVGEELGLVGTLLVLALLAALVWCGAQIAMRASDLLGTLVAGGSATLIGVQSLVNVLGVLGVIPLTGKALPFLSYGGSSVVSCLAMVGLVCSVSRHSRLPETRHDRLRSRMSVVDEDSEERRRGSRGSLRLLEGGARSSSRGRGQARTRGRERIDLGPSAADRLRPSRDPNRRR